MTIIIALITSVIGSFLFGRFYLNLQYHKSNAGFRQQQIMDCTSDLLKEYRENGEIDQDLHVKYQYALSEVIEQMILVYGIDPASPKSPSDGKFPALSKDNQGSEISFFKENIRPIMIDLNNNAFIGWINWVPNVQRLTTLWSFCFTIEKITVNLEFLKVKQTADEIVSTQNGLVVIKENPEYKKEIDELKNDHELIKNLWFKWIEVNKMT